MRRDFPYVLVPGKISELFRRISDAKVPDSFSHSYLKDTLGFKSTNDRPLISLLKNLGFLDQSGNPTSRYRELKNDKSKGAAVAAGLKEAFGPLFDANERAHELSAEDLKGLIAQIAGTDRDMTSRISSTFNALLAEADFNAVLEVPRNLEEEAPPNDTSGLAVKNDHMVKIPESVAAKAGSANPEFHFNIQVHLPNNGTEETYLNIFNALREAFR